MKSTPRSGRRFNVRIASARSGGGPQIPLPTMRMAPKPRRLTSNASPILNRPDRAAFDMGTPGVRRRFSGPARLGRHGRQNGGDVASGLQPENRAAIVEQIELDVTPAADELFLALGRGPRRRRVAPHDVGIDRDKTFADVAHEGEVLLEGGVFDVSGAVEPVEKNAAD